ncbi:MFS transporter [Aliiglaciecola lipolytica]|uniref:MFS transporter n=1 Tax=Aliiglaciecola lipolytica TaxID=477689 RepID=UPI0002EEF8D0|nr:MFS transporter [Aliiglaciecola lipolytica]
MLAAIITLVMPYCLSVYQPNQIFMFFTFMMLLQLLFVARLMPETKGKTLEEMQSRI